MLGSGSYGSVEIRQLAAKTYSPTSLSIPRDAIREASILRHLNDSGVKSVPRLHSVINQYENDTSITTATMDLVGRSLNDRLKELESSQDKCDLVERYLGKIVSALREVHKAGIIHNDTTGNNIMITDDGRVFIIDFGVSTFGDVNDAGEWATRLNPNIETADDNHIGTSYDLDIGYKSHNTPDFHAHLRTFYSTDYWSLAAWIVNNCSGKPEYIPVIHDGSGWARIIRLLEDRTYSKLDLDDGIIESNIIIPPTITPTLATKLRPMLRLSTKKWYSIPPSLSSFRLGLSRDNYEVASAIINEMIYVFNRDRDDVPQRIGIAIDLIRRVFNYIAPVYSPQIIGVAITTIVNDRFDDELIFELVDKYNLFSTDQLNRLINQILELVGWRVITRTNVQLSNQSSSYDLINKLRNSKNSYRLLIMSDAELREYLTTMDDQMD